MCIAKTWALLIFTTFLPAVLAAPWTPSCPGYRGLNRLLMLSYVISTKYLMAGVMKLYWNLNFELIVFFLSFFDSKFFRLYLSCLSTGRSVRQQAPASICLSSAAENHCVLFPQNWFGPSWKHKLRTFHVSWVLRSQNCFNNQMFFSSLDCDLKRDLC